MIVNISLLVPKFYPNTLKSIQLDTANSVYYNHALVFSGSCSSNHNILTKLMNLSGDKMANLERLNSPISNGNRIETEEHVRRRKIRWSRVNVNNGDKYLQRMLSKVTP